jgi:indolepyruvate ferredoxin oxidoreductase beta subunit
MKFDIVLAGVGGQGVLSISAIIASSAMKEGLHVKQSEVHGMSQRGGAVQANLRLSDEPIASDLIPRGRANMIISMEPMESLRYLGYLSKDGTLLTATKPVENIPDYPDLEGLLDKIRSLPNAILLDSDRLAREAGSARASNMVIVGAAARFLPVTPETIQRFIREVFARKGDKVVQTNLDAFEKGREAAA